MAHFVPCTKTITIEETTRLFVDDVYQFIDYLMISYQIEDHNYFQILDIFLWNPQGWHQAFFGISSSNGRSDRTCQLSLRTIFINYQQDDWTSYLPLAEFAYNNTIHASMQQTPFYANYGHHPKLDLLDPSKADNLATTNFATWLLQLQDAMQFQLQEAQDRYKTFANESSKEHPLLQVGNKVWFLWCNIKTTRPCDKLDYQRIGPFPIQKQINQVAYRLTLLAWRYTKSFMFPF